MSSYKLSLSIEFDNGRHDIYYTNADKASLELCIMDGLKVRLYDKYDREVIIDLSKCSYYRISEHGTSQGEANKTSTQEPHGQ